MLNPLLLRQKSSDFLKSLFTAYHADAFRSRHYLAFLFIATIGTYYSLILGGDFISLDDWKLMNRLLNEPSLDWKALFFPPGIGFYYRPLVELSFRLDHLLWFDIAAGYYLTNVVLHLLNTFSVYWIALLLFSRFAGKKEKAAFFSALLFAVHPLATESVCWVSGRSDLIAAAFLLPSFALYLLFQRTGRRRFLMFSGLLYLLAAMAKEVALMLPALVIAFEFLYHRNFFKEKSGKTAFIVSGFFVVLTVLYFLFFRGAGLETVNMKVGVGSSGLRTVSHLENILFFFASIGFYVKKMLMPYPLNFAIHDIPLMFYGLVGIGLLTLFFIRGIRPSSRYGFFIAWVLITIVPAVFAAVLKLPWVPWAERYLYIPLVGLSCIGGLLFASPAVQQRKGMVLLFVALVGVLWFSTLHRSRIWIDELRLWKDTAEKADYAPVYYFYGKTLLNKGLETEAMVQLNKAIAQGYSYYPSLLIAGMHAGKGEYVVAEKTLRMALNDFPEQAEVHRYLAENYLRMAEDRKSTRKRYYEEAIAQYIQYVNVYRDDAHINLKIARLYRAVGREKRAVPFLDRILETAPESEQAAAAERLLREIMSNRGAR